MAHIVSSFGWPLIAMLCLNILGHCEMSIYPGLRRKPLQPALQSLEVPSDFLAQLMEENARRRLVQQFEQQLELINAQMARQRQRQEQRERYRQQQLQELLEEEGEREDENDNEIESNENVVDDDDYATNSYVNSNENNNINKNQYEQYDNSYTVKGSGSFSYQLPKNMKTQTATTAQELDKESQDRSPFAVGPFDARFYEEADNNNNNNNENDALDASVLDDYEEYVPAVTNIKATTAVVGDVQSTNDEDDDIDANKAYPKSEAAAGQVPVLSPATGGDAAANKLLDNSASTNFYRIKPQSAAAAAAAMKPMLNAGSNSRHDITALIDKLQKQGKSNTIVNNEHAAYIGQNDAQMVLRQHLGVDGEMYVVALVAGMSAAVIVGVIALVVAWCTLRSKAKAAADVEYPAYGVTGPNKDISPSGDRKLAQSAQMYHFQHQKQQIIAMENRQAVEGSCGLSDVESDDDNDEGDYTVYECPGLAPTGEMEVKNPLFLDETPMTPSNNVTVTTSTTATPTNNITQATAQQPQTARKAAAGKSATSMATSSEDNKNKKRTKK